MKSYFPGTAVLVDATFADATGTLVTPSPVSVAVTDPTGAPVTVGAASFPTTGNGQALTSPVSLLGTYNVTWSGTASGDVVTIEYQFQVLDTAVNPDPLAVAVMVAYCGWNPLTPVTNVTAVLDGNDSQVIALPCLNVTAVTAVTVTASDGSSFSPTIGLGNQVGWSTNGCLTWNWWVPNDPLVVGYFAGFNWPGGQQNIAVTYSGGYSRTPDDLAAALASVGNRLTSMGRTSARLGQAAFTYGSVVGSGGLLLVEQMVFDKYRLPRVA